MTRPLPLVPVLVLVLVLEPWLVIAADAPARVLGKVKTAAADGTGFELSAKGGTTRVVPADKLAVLRLKPGKLGDLDTGPTIHVLGRYQPPSTHPETQQQVPAQVGNIVAIVVVPPDVAWAPPPVAPDLAEKKMKWESGRLDKRAAGLYALGDRMMIQAGRDRSVVHVAAETASAIEKGRTVLVEGALDAAKKELRAERVTLVAPEVPAAELRAILGL